MRLGIIKVSYLKNIIYISGSGRSGSTLLERIFHSSSNASALGEFHCLWRLASEQITCSCGTPFLRDEFWQSVLQDAGVDASAIAELARLETLFARSSFIARHNFSLNALARNPDVQRFLAIQFALFESVARLSGKSILIDSSKAGPRAWLLACDPRTRILHLYRDPADVIASWRSKKFDQGLNSQMKRMPVSRAAMDWWKVEQLILMLARQRKVARIDYENLCTSPESLVMGLIEQLDLSDGIQPSWIDSSTVHQGGDYHSLNGNPDRFERGPIQIAFRGTDWQKMDASERFRIRATAAAIRLFYASHP